MTEKDEDVARRRAHTRHINAGATQRIKDLLEKGPKSKEQIEEALSDVKKETIKALLYDLMNRTGGVMTVAGTGGRGKKALYQLTKYAKLRQPRFNQESPYAMAMPITDGRKGYRWWSGPA